MEYRRTIAWLALALCVLALQHLLLSAAEPSPTTTATAAPSSFASAGIHCTGLCCRTPLAPPSSLLVVLPPGEAIDAAALDSWSAFGVAIIVAWGAAACAATASVLAEGSAARVVCTPNESGWHAARACNLAAQLSTGRLLVVLTRANARLTPAVAERLLSIRDRRRLDASLGLVHADATTGVLAIERDCWAALRGWDERLIGNGAQTFRADALRDSGERAEVTERRSYHIRHKALMDTSSNDEPRGRNSRAPTCGANKKRV